MTMSTIFVYCVTGAAAIVASIVHDGFMNPIEGEESVCDWVQCGWISMYTNLDGSSTFDLVQLSEPFIQ